MQDVCSAASTNHERRCKKCQHKRKKKKLDIIFCDYVLNGRTVGGGRVDAGGDHVGSSGWVDRRQ